MFIKRRNKKRAVTKKSTSDVFNPQNYTKLLEQIKADIWQTQLRSALSITKELIMLYWRIGKILIEKPEKKVGEQSPWNAYQEI